MRAHLRYNVEYPRDSRILIEESRLLNEVDLAATREKQMAILNAYRDCELQSAGKFRTATHSAPGRSSARDWAT